MKSALPHPSSIFLLFSFGYLLLLLAGPYRYPFNPSAVIYLLACGVCFFVGLVIGEKQRLRVFRLTPNRTHYGHSYFVLIFILVVSAISFGDLFYEYARLGFPTPSEYREIIHRHPELRGEKSILVRLADRLVIASPAFALLAIGYKRGSARKIVFTLSLLVSAAYGIANGGRTNLILMLMLLISFALLIYCSMSSKERTRDYLLGGKFTIAAVFSVGMLFVFYLFIIRRQIPPDISRSILDYGVASLRQEYSFLLHSDIGTAFLRLSYYLTHSIAVFSAAWPDLSVAPQFFGMATLRPGSFICEIFAVTWCSYSAIQAASPVSGAYPTAVYTFVVDFGLILAPAALLAVGVLLGSARPKFDANNRFSIAFYIIACVIPILFWIYPFFFGGLDHIVGLLVILWLISVFKHRKLLMISSKLTLDQPKGRIRE